MKFQGHTRDTRQRRVVLEELRRTHSHPTADELFLTVRARLPHISLGTVYRNLDLLCRNGQAQRLEQPSGPARYDGDMEPHFHVRCEQCGRLEDVPVNLAPQGPMPATTPGGMTVTGMRVEWLGICAACRAETFGN